MSSLLFSSNEILNDVKSSGPTARSLTADSLTEAGIVDADSWRYDQPGDAIKSTQQLPVDWSDFSKHTYFMPATAKVNLAFDRIINQYPFDGTSIEKEKFFSGLTGYENHVLKSFPRSTGSINFIADSNTYVAGTDRSGFLFPELALDKSGRSVISRGNLKPFTIETQIAIPTGSFDTQNQAVFQFMSPDGYQGLSLFVSGSVASDPNAKIMLLLSSGSSTSNVKDLWISGSIPKGKFNHVAFTYDRGLYERMTMYLDGNVLTSSYKQLEITGSLGLGNSTFYFATGSKHNARLSIDSEGFSPSQIFTGSLDEFRFWTAVRPQEKIRKYSTRNVDNTPELALYYRFNEPKSRGLKVKYKSKNVVLDYSGNGLHGIITNYTDACRDVHYESKLSHEKLNENPCLFPDHEDLIYYNSQLLLTASRYDANNPNMITKLVPRHYFTEAKFFEGRENNEGEVIETYGFNSANYGGDDYALPRYGQIPQAQLLTSFLLIWANFFDDLKIFLDYFSKIRAANHDQYNTIPLQFMPAMAEIYGLNLPNPFSGNSADSYIKGNNTTSDGNSEQGLKNVLEQLWRRTLTEMPYLLRSRGTIQSIRSLMATMGINLDTSFRIREFGGAKALTIDHRRKRKSSDYRFVDFVSGVDFLTSSNLAIYRHEPGLPFGGPAVAKTHFQSAGIVVSSPADPPILTQVTSGSWSWEANYTFNTNSNLLTQSLYRIETKNSTGQSNLLLNLLAMRNDSEVSPNYRVQLLVSSSNSSYQQIELKNVNCFDGARWYFNINHSQGPVSSSYDLRVKRANIDNVTMRFSGSNEYLNDSGSLLTHLNPTLNPAGCYFTIGTSEQTYTTNYLKSNQANCITDFSGKVGSMRLWSKSLTDKESEEHALNFLSIGTEDPIITGQFPGIDPNNSLAQTSTLQPDITLPEGSWERIRGQYELWQNDITGGSAKRLEIDDISQNGIKLICKTKSENSKAIIATPVLYSIIDPNWDINSTQQKVRVRSYQDFETAQREDVHYGLLHNLDGIKSTDDRRFSIEASMVQGLNEDIVNVMADLGVLNEYLGAPELEYAVEYPELNKLREKYFMRLTEPVNYDSLFKFFKWFDMKFSPMIESFLPRTVEFLGVNFVIESHMLERNKIEYKQGDVHVDIFARKAVTIEPIYIGTIRSEIS